MTRRRISLVIAAIGCILAIVLGIMIRFPPGVPPTILPELDPLPAPEEPPGYDQVPVEIDNVTLGALVQFYMFMPHNGLNSFSFHLEINVTNNGLTDIDDFNATKASVFFANGTLLYTFGLLPSGNATIEVGERRNLGYDEDRDMPTVLGLLGWEEYYLRVLVTFNSNTSIIVTTPVASVGVAIE
ncbi:MAG: hypothetical protein P1Q69_13460 [Candidatus Thorarchaeota archaeon]|nr:hypothetical protein [Candidatus Thorarchaeota archaeon]